MERKDSTVKNMKFWRTALVAALVLTVMLSVTGGTIAWFTDSVSSANNVIQAGNLDIELQYKKPGDETWTAVTEETELFDNSTLWEPGHTEVVALRIENAGTLALKYDLKVKINSESASTNVYGEEFKLSNYLEVYNSAIQNGDIIGDIMVDLLINSGRNGINVTDMNKSDFDMGLVNDNPNVATNLTLNQGQAVVTALVITMPTTVGNEANHMTDVAAPSITFGIELEATQATVEEDSFGSDYDADALFPSQVTTADELKSALADGKKNISLANNTMNMGGETIALPDGVTIADGTVANATLTVADGQTANFDNVTFDDTTSVQAQSDGNLNFQDCKFDVTPDKLVGNSRGAAIIGSNQYNTIDLILEGCTFNYKASSADTYNAAVFMWSSVKNVIVRNCTFNDYGFVAVKLMNLAEGANIVFDNNTFNMSAENSANYWYNCAVQIVPQHDREMNVTFKNNKFNGSYQKGSDLQSKFGFTDNNNPIVVELAGMNYAFGLSELTLTQEGNTVNNVPATDANFAVKRAEPADK